MSLQDTIDLKQFVRRIKVDKCRTRNRGPAQFIRICVGNWEVASERSLCRQKVGGLKISASYHVAEV